MGYEELVEALGTNGQGVHACSQDDFISRTRNYSVSQDESDWRGICRGLVVTWLRCKKADESFLADPNSFWAPWSQGESTSLLGQSKQSTEALGHQHAYNLGSDEETVNTLKEAGLTLSKDEIITKDSPVQMAWLALVTAILSTSPRFFILSLKRDGGGHSVGFVRQWKLIGKSTTTYFFDPNFGEVQANNRSGLETVLVSIDNKTLYNNRYKKHTLYPFSY